MAKIKCPTSAGARLLEISGGARMGLPKPEDGMAALAVIPFSILGIRA